MDKVSSKEACRMAVDLIEAQLGVLPLSLAMLSSLESADGASRPPTAIQLQRKRRPLATGSAAVIAAADAGLDTDDNSAADAGLRLTFDISAARQALQDNASRMMHAQQILVGNALLAVGMFLKENGISTTRTPEVQFLGHVCNAILCGNTFRIESGYVPGASFDGLVIDSSLDGARLFDDRAGEGFMGFGDAVALLQRLAQYLRGTQDFVSGGDAG